MSSETTTAPADIRIDDLANPRLTPTINAAREGAPDAPDTMSVQEVLDQASAMTGGLTDFGEDTGFRERLAVALKSLQDDAGLTRGGRVNLLQVAVRSMANRLRIEDLV